MMERIIVKFGFGVFCFFLMCMFAIGSQFIWGVLAGLAILGFGWYFWDEQ